MKTKDIIELERAILTNFNNGNYSPLGADGGCLKYITCPTNGRGRARASITTDSEIANIRQIWAIDLDTDGKGFKNIYNETNLYYKLRP